MGGIYILPQFRGLQLAGGTRFIFSRNCEEFTSIKCILSSFEELENFYKKYGYTEVDTTKEVVHPIILEKYNWCLGHYDKHVLLFKL